MGAYAWEGFDEALNRLGRHFRYVLPPIPCLSDTNKRESSASLLDLPSLELHRGHLADDVNVGAGWIVFTWISVFCVEKATRIFLLRLNMFNGFVYSPDFPASMLLFNP